MPDPRPGGRALSQDDLHAWFEDWLEACNRHDLDRVRELLHPEVRRAGRATGADARLRDLTELLSAFPDQRWKRITVVVEDDRVAAHLRTRGTHRGEWRGLRATGRHVSLAELGFYRIVGGRIVEHAGAADDVALLAQLRD